MDAYPHYICCAMLTTRSARENDLCMAQAKAIADILNVPYVIVEGAYKGARETSLDLYGPNAERCARILQVAFDQETYLEISSYHDAALILADGRVACTFTQRIAADGDNYSIDSLGNRYTFA